MRSRQEENRNQSQCLDGEAFMYLEYLSPHKNAICQSFVTFAQIYRVRCLPNIFLLIISRAVCVCVRFESLCD